MAFFDCHRKIVFREAEGDIWAKDYQKGTKPKLSTYPVPMASPDEILIEKTPHIINRGYGKLKARAELMKKTMKDVKILVMLCDPVKRFISLEKHHTPVNWSATTRDKLTGIGLKLSTDNPGQTPSKDQPSRSVLFHRTRISNPTVSNTKKHIKAFMNWYKENKNGSMIRPTAGEMSHHKMPKITGITGSEWNNLRYGNYYHQIKPFYEVFGSDRIIFLDGTNMGTIQNQNQVTTDCP